MMTSNRILIRADIHDVYHAAADVQEWPRLLSHYRRVRLLDGDASGRRRMVEMAASRDGFPCAWTAEMTMYPEEFRIGYKHTISTWTKGMEVWWILKRMDDGSVEATITHEMPRSNSVMEWFRKWVVGRMFVENIADKTLRGLKQHLERGVS